jgi:hypothetical protein
VPPLVCEPVIEPLVHKEKVARRFAEHASLHVDSFARRGARQCGRFVGARTRNDARMQPHAVVRCATRNAAARANA